MNSIALLNSAGGLQWVKPSWLRRRYELLVNGSIGGEIVFRGICGSRASASAGSRHWTIERRGFVSRLVTVHDGSDVPIAIFTPKWHGGGPLLLRDGTQLRWAPEGFFRQKWHFVAQNGERLVTFRHCGPLRQRMQVQVSSSVAEDTVALLAVLGCYLMVLQQEDSAVVIAPVAS